MAAERIAREIADALARDGARYVYADVRRRTDDGYTSFNLFALGVGM